VVWLISGWFFKARDTVDGEILRARPISLIVIGGFFMTGLIGYNTFWHK